ncbi:LOW QUALITY PROTEIN: AP20 region protein 1 [Rhinolophus ferrumequinum]|uniref:LOW QUALITY PROTEIN: AP20 region protein 1 n=1 Tax=Rhinolophus ferrumequinum TaxID=59479 RepID=UPI00140FEEBC|nr:LOW QUALITY PROTEIN: AP20 region protein 1 [Rhinolophus ferrumequinum]
MKTMATRKRCKLPRTGQDFENVIKSLLCVRIFHTRIGGDLTPAIINRGRPANAEQMGLYASAKHVNVFPLDLWTQDDSMLVSLVKNKVNAVGETINMPG